MNDDRACIATVGCCDCLHVTNGTSISFISERCSLIGIDLICIGGGAGAVSIAVMAARDENRVRNIKLQKVVGLYEAVRARIS